MVFADILKYFELSYYICAIVGLLSFIWGFYAFVIYRKQLHSNTLSRCIDIFRRDFTELAEKPTIENCTKYVDFVNEELFYMQHGFVPNDIAREWLYGIIIHFPVFVNGENGNPSNVSKVIVGNDLLSSFPRLVHAFTLKGVHNLADIYNSEAKEISLAKRNMVNEILENIKRYKSN